MTRIVVHAHTELIANPQSHAAWRLLRATLRYRDRLEADAARAARAQESERYCECREERPDSGQPAAPSTGSA